MLEQANKLCSGTWYVMYPPAEQQNVQARVCAIRGVLYVFLLLSKAAIAA